jgi:hypothetical protein
MTTRARRTKRKGSAPAKGRRKSQPRRAHKPTASVVRTRSRAHREIPDSPARRSRELPAIINDQATEQEKPPESGLDFLWRVSRDEKALDGLCRLMRNASVNLLVVLTPVTVVAYVAMPVRSELVKAIVTVISMLLIAIGSLIRFRSKKRRPGRLAIWRTANLNCLIAAAQEAEDRFREPDGDGRENDGRAHPARYAPTTRKRRRGPCSCCGTDDSGFNPVRNQRQAAPAAYWPIGLDAGVRRGQGRPGLLVSGHLAILVEPAYPDRRKPRNSASMFRMRGAGLSRPSVNIMHPAVTYCLHEVHGPCRIHYLVLAAGMYASPGTRMSA